MGPQSSFPEALESRGSLTPSLSPGGQPELTARWLQLVPKPQLTVGQERCEDRDAQHVVSAQDRVAVEVTRPALIGRRRAGPPCQG